ncbi:short chain dehydrogenase family protein [Candida albicans]|uniref:Short chain dehydrogenase family protein n=1 Tax=Candida albicans TaxID=5476 RepID=A0A8H6BSI8_CANAX|nr:short chain dehydrogenase family protein [Candida albicans]
MSHVSIVTGASRGIGKAIAEILLKTPSSKVVIVARSQAPLESFQKQHGSDRVAFVAGDITDPATSKTAVETAISKFGQLNAVIANACVGPIENTSVDQLKQLYDINVFSVVELIKHSLPHLKKTNGKVIGVSSIAAFTAFNGWYAYGSSKAALNHLMYSLASEEKEIQAIAVAPGVVDTEMQNDIREKFGKNMKEEALQQFVDLHKNEKLVSPEEPGTVYANLALKGWSEDLNGKYLDFDDALLKDYQL